MSVNFANDREAVLAVLSLVIGADDVGSLEERDFLLQRVKTLELFADVSQGEFNKLLGGVTEQVYDSLPQEDGVLTAAGVDQLLGAAQKALNPALREELVRIAGELSDADGASGEESALLAQLKHTLLG
jgi:hypothetical protein